LSRFGDFGAKAARIRTESGSRDRRHARVKKVLMRRADENRGAMAARESYGKAKGSYDRQTTSGSRGDGSTTCRRGHSQRRGVNSARCNFIGRPTTHGSEFQIQYNISWTTRHLLDYPTPFKPSAARARKTSRRLRPSGAKWRRRRRRNGRTAPIGQAKSRSLPPRLGRYPFFAMLIMMRPPAMTIAIISPGIRYSIGLLPHLFALCANIFPGAEPLSIGDITDY
jgi:hypothetical protein